MTNTKKIIVLGALLLVLAVLLICLFRTNSEIDLIVKKLDKNDTVEKTPVAPLITMNAAINQALDSFSYKNAIIDQAVVVAQKSVEAKITDGAFLSDAMISDIVFVETGIVGFYDSVNMFNVELSFTLDDGTIENDKTNYIIFYNRWDEDGKGSYFVSSLTESQIAEKYSESASTYSDNVYIAACMLERDKYLKAQTQFTDDELADEAHRKAVAYASTLKDVRKIVYRDFLTDDNGGIRRYNFETDINDVFVSVTYMLVEENNTWVFLYAYSG